MFTLEFKLGNASFADDMREEIARILRNTAARVREGYTSGYLHDSNGNKVGSWDAQSPWSDES